MAQVPAENPASATPQAAMRIGNTIAEMSKVAEFVEGFGRAHGLPGNVVNDMNLCLDELLNNTISYGYADAGRHFISVSLQIEGCAVVAALQDDARPFDPRRASVPERSGGLDRPRAGGLGLRFVNALMDEVDYVRSGQYNQVKLKKMLQPPDAVMETEEATGK
jgi:anti-sigma regulatory factor (Ser/Thr protein kinase)